MRNRLRKEDITDGTVAEALGMSRTQLNQMFNHAQPMRLIYKWALIGYMVMRRANQQGPSKL